MTEELNTPTTPTEPTMGNTPEARTPDGTIIDQGAAAPETPPQGAPETYADFTAPEGVTLDKETLAEAAPIFKELGLTQEQAQKLVDFYRGLAARKPTSHSLRPSTTCAQTGGPQVMADKDIGGKLDAVKIEARPGQGPYARRDSHPLSMKPSTSTGLGDHPAIIKGFYEMAKLVNEGTHVSGRGPSEGGQTPPGKAARPTLGRRPLPEPLAVTGP